MRKRRKLEDLASQCTVEILGERIDGARNLLKTYNWGPAEGTSELVATQLISEDEFFESYLRKIGKLQSNDYTDWISL